MYFKKQFIFIPRNNVVVCTKVYRQSGVHALKRCVSFTGFACSASQPGHKVSIILVDGQLLLVFVLIEESKFY